MGTNLVPPQQPLSYQGGLRSEGPGPGPHMAPPPPPTQQPVSDDNRQPKNANGHLYERQMDSPEPLPPGIDNFGMSPLFSNS